MVSLGLKLIISVFGGLGLHQFHRPTGAFGPRWSLLLRYAIGYLGTLPFVLLFVDSKDRDKYTIAHILAGFMVGAGVFFGFLLDDDEK